MKRRQFLRAAGVAAAANAHFKKLYDSLVAFRGDSLLWLQVAEFSFDSLMMRMRSRT